MPLFVPMFLLGLSESIPPTSRPHAGEFPQRGFNNADGRRGEPETDRPGFENFPTTFFF